MKDEIQRINEAIEYFDNTTRDELLSFLDGEDEVLMQIALLNLQEIGS